MGERIKELRKALGLTQQEFADRIGVKRNTIAQYESGRNEPIDAVISLICLAYDVNEGWLRSGEKPMFKPKTRNQELIRFATSVANGGENSVQAQLLAVMARLTDEQWEVLAQVAHEFVEETKKAGPQ